MSAARDTAVIQRARDWLSFASPREPGWVLIRDLAAEIDNLTLQNEACGNALVDSEAVNQRLSEAAHYVRATLRGMLSDPNVTRSIDLRPEIEMLDRALAEEKVPDAMP